MSVSLCLRAALVAGVSIAALVASPALAQEDDAQEAAEAAATTDLEQEFEDDMIVVTGSRIRRETFDTVEPAVVIDEEIIEARGYTNIADALNELPSFGVPGNSQTGAQGFNDVGQNFVNFFGLGSQRTLTVVNGRRFVAANAPTVFNNAAPGLQVDLNVLPIGLIDRIETIAVGGAPVYGSDAIAGTVNVILKRNFEGMELTSSYGISERGDVDDFRVGGIFGGNFADGRGNAVISVEYNKKGGLLTTEREEFAESLSYQSNPLNTGPDDGIPDRVLITDPRVTFVTHSGLPSFFFGNPFIGEPVTGGGADILQFDSSGNLVPFDAGERFGLVFSSGGDGLNLSDLTNLLTPFRRTLINGLGRYEAFDGVEAYVELFYANTRANDQISQAGYNTDFFAGSSAALEFGIDNPFLTEQARGVLQGNCDRLTADALAAGDPDPFADGCSFLLSRTIRGVALGDNEVRQNLYRIVGGVRGDFELLGNSWDYDVSLNFGRTENDSQTDGLHNRRFSFALDAVRIGADDIAGIDPDQTLNIVRGGNVLLDVAVSGLQAGDIVCGVELDRPEPPAGNLEDEGLTGDIDQCVPLNYFGEPNASPEARDYVNVPFTSSSGITQKIFEANVGGELFDLWAGPVAVAFGYQHRREDATFDPDAGFQLGIGRSAPINPTAGGFSTNEFYGEANIPLIDRDMGWPVISSAIAELRARHVDNSRAGSDWTYTAGGRIGLFDDAVTFRGNYTRSIRSPALVELFLPVSTTFSQANDPCDASNITAGANPQNREANCRAEAAALGFTGIDDFSSTIINGTAQGTTGGNSELENEKADAFALGIIVAPPFVPRLSLAVDYVNIKIDDAISNLDLTSVMEACYDADPGSFPNEFCGRFSRLPGNVEPARQFQVDNGFSTGYLNAGTREFQGVTAQLTYDIDVGRTIGNDGDLGRLSVNGQVFHLIEDLESVTGFDIDDDVGEVGTPKWRGQLNLRYDLGQVGLLWQTRYIGSAIVDNNDTDESRDILGVGDYWLFNAGVAFRPTENIEVQFNVDNVFDQDQPFAAGALANGPFVYDFIGRYYRAGAKIRF